MLKGVDLMKTELFPINEKSELFSKAHPMHDCSFVATFEQNTLVLTFDNLQNYFDAPPVTYWFDEYRKLTIKYHNTEFVNLRLKYGKKEKEFYDTVEPLNGKGLIMYSYSVDCFNQMTLDFYVMIKKKLWGGKMEIAPDKIEYIWE
jgi:hypothetical protein